MLSHYTSLGCLKFVLATLVLLQSISFEGFSYVGGEWEPCTNVCTCAIIQLIIYCQLQRIKLQSVLVRHGILARCGAIGQTLSTVPGTMQLQHQGVGRIPRKVLQGMPGAPGARGSRLYSQPQGDPDLAVPWHFQRTKLFSCYKDLDPAYYR